MLIIKLSFRVSILLKNLLVKIFLKKHVKIFMIYSNFDFFVPQKLNVINVA